LYKNVKRVLRLDGRSYTPYSSKTTHKPYTSIPLNTLGYANWNRNGIQKVRGSIPLTSNSYNNPFHFQFSKEQEDPAISLL
jgi:hypothetical protein